MHGFYGRILHIDLTARTFRTEAVDDSVYETYLGGKGLASYLLYTLNPPGVDPKSPENRLIFATGPTAQSPIWGSSRYGVYTKSPLTGLYAGSYSGGKAPEAIDAAGYDAVVLTGESDKPVVLAIDPDGVTFHDGAELWGKDTFETEDAVIERFTKKEKGKKRGAVVIGPAAENGAAFGVIENDYWRSAGRGGVGTVMGNKKVKAIAFSGDRKRELSDPKAVRGLSKLVSEESKENAGVKAYKSFGTPMMVKVLNSVNAFPTRYWSEGTCDHWEKIGADALHSQCDVTPNACAKCLMACGRMTTVKEGRHKGLKLEGPEYETLYAFGGLCMVDSIEEICHLNDICDRLGMDTITGGNLCAFAIEAVRRGKIEYDIDYGDVDAIAGLLEKIANNEGIGAILAPGIKHAAKVWGLEDIAVHVKGMEPAGYDPRVLKGMGLAYGTSDRGACHLRATFYKPELAGMIPPDQIEDKAELFVDFEDRLTLFDTLVFCRFYRDIYGWELLGEVINSTTGVDGSKDSIKRIADNVTDIVRKFNLREGLTLEDDKLPPALHKELKKSGHVIKEEEMEHLLGDYYRLRGWNAEGHPAP